MNDEPEAGYVHLSQAFDALATLSEQELSPSTVLDRVTELAKLAIPGAAETTITLVTEQHVCTAAGTSSRVIYLDERQYDAGRGPGLHAAQTDSVVWVYDMATEGRWPHFAHAALTHYARSSLSVPLALTGALKGALNMYSNIPNAFDKASCELALTFAEYAAAALTSISEQLRPDATLRTQWKLVPAHPGNG